MSAVDYAWNPVPAGGLDLYDLGIEVARGPFLDPYRLHLVRQRAGRRSQWALAWWLGPRCEGAGIWFRFDRSISAATDNMFDPEPIRKVLESQWGAKKRWGRTLDAWRG